MRQMGKFRYYSNTCRPRLGPGFGFWLGLEFCPAKATPGQVKASGFQARPSQNITIRADTFSAASILISSRFELWRATLDAPSVLPSFLSHLGPSASIWPLESLSVALNSTWLSNWPPGPLSQRCVLVSMMRSFSSLLGPSLWHSPQSPTFPAFESTSTASNAFFSPIWPPGGLS